MTLAEEIATIWEELFQQARKVDRSLVAVKKKFTEITCQQVTQFAKDVDALDAVFHSEGPGTVGGELDRGIEVLAKMKKDVEKFEKERQELANAEKLFDLPVTMYPKLMDMQKELAGLEKVFSLYEAQRVRETL